MGVYTAVVYWQRQEEDFLSNRYSRAHRWLFDGGAEVLASPSPQVVPTPMSVEEYVDPEEAFVASLSSCHMLFFLHLCARAKFVVDEYRDEASGTLAKDERGKTAMTRVVLKPQIKFGGDRVPSRQELEGLHHEAHELCFIANSVTSEVVTEILEPS